MSDEEQLAIREYLARAQGWDLVSPTRTRNPEGLYIEVFDGSGGMWPNPFEDADDLLALLEWARRQKWFMAVRVGNIGVAVDHGFPKKECAAQGSFQEALPLAIYQVLQERV